MHFTASYFSCWATLAKSAEYTAIATSAIGAIASAITEQAVYAVAPMSLALSLSTINRRRFEQRLRQEQSNKIEQISNQLEQLPSAIDRQVAAELIKGLGVGFQQQHQTET